MSLFPRPVGPRAALSDLRAFIGQPRRHHIVFAAAAVGASVLLMLAVYLTFAHEKEWQPPQIVYVKQWDASRSIAEIKAQQAKDLPAELAAQKAVKDAALKRQREFQRLAKKLGI